MNPITHGLAAWCLAETAPRLTSRERGIVVIAGVAPDLDGIGMVPEAWTRNGSHPLLWWSNYHHFFAHNLAFAFLVAFVAALVTRTNRALTAAFAFLAVHLLNVTTSGAAFVNSRCFGEDFALWLKQRLQEHGLASSEPVQEDWGWGLPVPHRGHRFTLSIGVMDDSIGRTPAEWRVGVTYEKPLNGFRAWFQPLPTAELADLSRVVEAVLREDPQISGIASA